MTADQVRKLAHQLAAAHPGRSVELRIPPYAAVQLGIGEARGAHRRGTPPTVVEMPPAVFIALCGGSRSWTECAGEIRASGIRADLSSVFPLTR